MGKRFLAVMLVFLMMFSLLPVGAFAASKGNEGNEGSEKTVVFTIDQKNYLSGGNIVQTDVAPYIKSLGDGTIGGRTMVPVAFLAPALGTEPAVWHPQERRVTIKKGNDLISITIGSKELVINGKKLLMDVEAEIKDTGDGTGGRTMLPISFIAKALEVAYQWEPISRTVSFYGYTKTYSEKGTFGPQSGLETIDGSVVVKADGVILQNLVIKGNLTIAEEVGDGDVTLNNITVNGETYIRGGGKDSIHINGGQYKNITVQNVNGKVRVVAKDVNNLPVVISEDAKGEEIILEGNFSSVKVEAEGINISTQGNTTIKEIIVSETAKETKLNLAKNTTVEKVVLDSKTEVKGTGTIKEAEIKADGVQFEKKPEKQTVSEKVKEAPKVETPASQPSTGGSSGGGGSSTKPVTGVSLNHSSATMILGGETLELIPTVTPDNATNKSVTWSSDVEDVATVDSNGVVTAVGVGTATITVTTEDGNKTATCTVTVVQAVPVTITGYEGSETEVVIPKFIEGSKIDTIDFTIAETLGADEVGIVTKIGDWALSYPAVPKTKFTIPDSVKIIGEGAFSGNALTHIEIPDSVTEIGYWAFSYNNLTSIIIPDSVTSIGEEAFENNQLTGITIPDSLKIDKSNGIVSLNIGPGAFGYNSFADFANIKLPDGITIIEDWFSNNEHLTSLDLPEGITTIGNNAFQNCGLKSVSIPDSVKSIGNEAFAYNALTSIVIPDSLKIEKDGETSLNIGRNAFSFNEFTNFSNIEMPHDITIIENWFQGNNEITDLSIPSNIKKIGHGAFQSSGLETVVIPDGVTDIGFNAFNYNKLISINIPNSVTSIGGSAFAWNKLTAVEIPDSVKSIGSFAFQYNNITSITIGEGVELGNKIINNNDDNVADYFLDVYNGAGTYTGTQTGPWTKVMPDTSVSTASLTSAQSVQAGDNNVTIAIQLKDSQGNALGGTYDICVSGQLGQSSVMLKESDKVHFNSQGEATINLSIHTAGTYNDAKVELKTASDTWSTIGNTFSIEVTRGEAAKLGIARQPFADKDNPQPIIHVLDEYGNIVTDFNLEVTAAVGVGVGDWTLEGTTPVTALGGIATFGDLTPKTTSDVLNATIVFSGVDLTPVESEPFQVLTPKILADESYTTGQFGKIEYVNVKFSEPVTYSTSVADYTVADAVYSQSITVQNVTSISFDEVRLTLDTLDEDNYTGVVSVTPAEGAITNSFGNTVASAPVNIKDKVKPAMSHAVIVSDDTARIYFSERITIDNPEKGRFQYDPVGGPGSTRLDEDAPPNIISDREVLVTFTGAFSSEITRDSLFAYSPDEGGSSSNIKDLAGNEAEGYTIYGRYISRN